jgi:predicted Zn-dependent peptidase
MRSRRSDASSPPRRVRLARLLAMLTAAVAVALPGAVLGRSSTEWDPSRLAGSVSAFRLDNGLRFVVLERHDSPVFSFRTYVDAGSVDEQAGQTGLAHMFEHMAFKGTNEIGTRDYGKEQKAIDKVDALFMQLYAERAKGGAADSTRLRSLQSEIAAAEKAADAYVETNEFGQIVDRVGGVGLNASTASDGTFYYYSLPSNQLELWAYLESERFLRPVFRQFYKERDVVIEERRMRVDSQPFGQFIEEMSGVAFRAHPYKSLGIGHRSDLDNLRLSDARKFYETYYTPQNMVIAVVGDVQPAAVERLARKYFARIPRRADPPPVHTLEPEQKGQRRFALEGDTQPIFGVAFHRPPDTHPDDDALAVLAAILGDGRTSRLNVRLVKRDKSALGTGAIDAFPGEKYPGLFIVFSIPNSGHSPEEMEKVTMEEIERLRTDLVAAEELARVKTEARANFIRGLASNSALAAQLSEFEARRGGWRKLFDEVAEIEAVTREQVRDAARRYLTIENSTVGYMVTGGAGGKGAQGQ